MTGFRAGKTVASASATTAEVRSSIEAGVRGLGSSLHRVRPGAMLIVLAGATLWPVAAPLLGTGAAVGAVGGIMGLLGGPGQAFISDFLERAANGGRAASELRAEFEHELLARLAVDTDEAADLRADVARLLQRVGGVEVALAAAGDARDSLACGLAELSVTWNEFGWMLSEVQDLLLVIQKRQAEGLVLQRAQLDLQREQLAKTNLLLRPRAQHARTRSTPRRAADSPREAIDVPSPYKGLEPFQAEDAELFFGRERLLAELLARLAEAPLLTLVGASGSGKSSLLRAGLVPAVWQDALPGSSGWPVAFVTPTSRPLESLAMRISLVRGIAPESLLADLHANAGALALTIRQALLDAPSHARFVLVVDQLEELFLLCDDEGERRQYLDALLIAAARPGGLTRVILSVRSDVYGALAAFPDAAAMLRDNAILIGPMAEEELRRAIELPAERVGLVLEPLLVDDAVRDCGSEPGALPLLSHALHETWRRRDGRTLTARGYHAAGGVQGSIARTADEVFRGMSQEQRVIARGVLLRLTGIAHGAVETRRRARVADLLSGSATAPAVERVVGLLVDARLLTADDGAVEVAHEALIRHWPRLREWLDEDREGLRVRARITQAADDWLREHRDPGALYRGARLAAAAEWGASHGSELNELERRFLDASAAAERGELEAAKRRTRRLRSLAIALGVLFVAALGATVFAISLSRVAQQEGERANSRSLAAAALVRKGTDLDLALLAGLEAYHTTPTVEARSSLLELIQQSPRLRATLRGHSSGSSVNDVAFTRDGRLLSAGEDGFVRLWDAGRARTASAPVEHGDDVLAIAVSPIDDTMLASAGSDGIVRLWKLDGRPWPASGRSATELVDIGFAPDGRTLVASEFGGGLRFWAVRGDRLADPVRRRAEAGALAFSPDGTTVATARDEGDSIELWDVAARRRVGTLPAAATESLAFSNDDRTLAAAVGRRIEFWDWRARTRRSGLEHGHGRVLAVAFDPSGSMLASAGADQQLRLWDARTHRQVGAELAGHASSVHALAFSPDSATLASASADSTVRIWNARRGVPLAEPGAAAPRPAAGAALSREGHVLATAQTDGSVAFWDPVKGRLPLSRSVANARGRITDLALSDDGRTGAALSVDGLVRVWDTRTGDVLKDGLQHRSGPTSVTLSPDGRSLVTTGLKPPFQFAGVTDRRPTPVPGPLPGFSAAISPDSTSLAAGLLGGGIALRHITAGGGAARSLRGHGAESTALAFDDGGRVLASGDVLGRIALWDLATGRPRGAPLEIHRGKVLALAFTRDGQILATAGADRTVGLVDLNAGRRLGLPLRGHDAAVQAVAVTAGGRLISADASGNVLLWDRLLLSTDDRVWRDRICRLVGRSMTGAEWKALLPDRTYRPSCFR